eukprot:5819065-Prymnesium_polylepis.1
MRAWADAHLGAVLLLGRALILPQRLNVILDHPQQRRTLPARYRPHRLSHNGDAARDVALHDAGDRSREELIVDGRDRLEHGEVPGRGAHKSWACAALVWRPARLQLAGVRARAGRSRFGLRGARGGHDVVVHVYDVLHLAFHFGKPIAGRHGAASWCAREGAPSEGALVQLAMPVVFGVGTYPPLRWEDAC